MTGRLGRMLVAALCLGAAGTGYAAEDTTTRTAPIFDEKAALAKSRAAIGRELADYRLLNTGGAETSLHAFRGKPLVISLIYTSCHHTCSMMTEHLARAVDIAREALGEDSFAVLTVGFDTQSDTPDRMRWYARERGIDVPLWTFASTDAQTVEGFTQDLGFSYFPSPRGFDHLTQTTLVTADGIIHEQVYGALMHSPTFVEPLKRLGWGMEAESGGLSGWIKGVRLFCTVYDPNTGRYTFDYSIFIAAVIGLLSLVSLATFVIRNWRRSKTPHRPA